MFCPYCQKTYKKVVGISLNEDNAEQGHILSEYYEYYECQKKKCGAWYRGGVDMESEFLSKYGDIDNFDEDKMQEDLTIFAVSVAMKEKRLQKEIDNFKNEKSIDVIMEYLQKRKELAEVYTEKIKQTEE